ncbi:MAG TPA: endospore germination permease [Clostridiales bacterium]|nr:endospore germination permease [Clostridiales bacterium]
MTEGTTKKENILSNVDLFVMLARVGLGAVSTGGVYVQVAQKAGRDGWISFILALGIIFFAIFIIVNLNKRFCGYTIIEYGEFILGKWGGKVLGSLLVLYFLLQTAAIVRFTSEMVITWMLNNTPHYMIMALIVFLAVYIARNGLLVVSRFCILVSMLVLALPILTFFPIKDWKLHNILPVGDSGFTGITSGVFWALFAYVGYEILLMLYPYVQDKRKVLRTSLLAFLYVGVLYTLFMAAIILLFGPSELIFFLYPVLNYLKAIDVPFVERVDTFILFITLFSAVANIGVVYTLTCLGVGQLFGIKRRKNIAIWLSPLVFAVAAFPKNSAVLNELYKFFPILNLTFGIFIPFILLVISVILKRSKEEMP